MLKSRIIQTFRQFLRDHLHENYASLPDVDSIIEDRCEVALKAYCDYQEKYRDSKRAYEHAMNILMQGYSFSKYDYVEEILLEHFPDKIEWRRRKRCIREYVAQLEPIFEQYEPDESNQGMRQKVIKYLAEN